MANLQPAVAIDRADAGQLGDSTQRQDLRVTRRLIVVRRHEVGTTGDVRATVEPFVGDCRQLGGHLEDGAGQ